MFVRALLVTFSLLLMAGAVLAQAPPPPLPPTSLPHAFYGTILIGGNPSPAGVLVEAYIEGEQKGNRTTVNEGEYGGPLAFDPKLLVKGNSSDSGKTIAFFVEGRETGQTYLWESGGVTQLSLTLDGFCGDTYCSGGETCGTCPADCGTCPSPPGGGGTSCTPVRSCTEWSDCVDGENTRVCTDARNCGTDEEKPEESKSCEIPKEEGPKVCVEGLIVCAGDDLMECTGDAWQKVQACEFGCLEGECNPQPSDGITGGITISEMNPLLIYSALVLITLIAVIGVMFWVRK